MCITLLWAAVWFLIGLLFWIALSSVGGLFVWAGGILQFYVLWFVAVLSTDFMPSQTLAFAAEPVNQAIGCLTCGVLPSRIGRWHLERAHVHGAIRARVKERGVASFFLPTAVDAKDIVDVEDFAIDVGKG